jgi:KRAB domain-containing zinc finger protein
VLACEAPEPTDQPQPDAAELLEPHAALHSSPSPDQIKCTLVFTSPEELKEHRKLHFRSLQFSCDFCGKVYIRKNNLMRHIQCHSQLRPLACEVPGCSFRAKFAIELRKHEEKEHTSIAYTCPLCGKIIQRRQNDFKSHVAKHNTDLPGVFKCLHPKCKWVCRNGDDLKKHTLGMHKFQCNECDKCFSAKSQVTRHIIWHMDERLFRCDSQGCSFSTKTIQALQTHKNNTHSLNRLTVRNMFESEVSVTQDKPVSLERVPTRPHSGCQETLDLTQPKKQNRGLYQCHVPDCSFSCQSRQDLKEHRKTMHPIWLFNCQVCGRGFDQSVNFKSHMRSHRTANSVETESKQAISRSELKKHLENLKNKTKSSTGHECQLCGKILKTKAHLPKHTLTHETGTPGVLKCNFQTCKLTFNSTADLKEHAPKHWDLSLPRKRPSFACDVPECDMAFKSLKLLTTHKNRKHDHWTCLICGQKLKSSLYSTRHMRDVHELYPST